MFVTRLFLADQTPTPTRFLKNCEEVGLFNELASSFEQEFCKSQDDEQRTKHPVRTNHEQHIYHSVGLKWKKKGFCFWHTTFKVHLIGSDFLTNWQCSLCMVADLEQIFCDFDKL